MGSSLGFALYFCGYKVHTTLYLLIHIPKAPAVVILILLQFFLCYVSIPCLTISFPCRLAALACAIFVASKIEEFRALHRCVGLSITTNFHYIISLLSFLTVHVDPHLFLLVEPIFYPHHYCLQA